MISVYGPCKGIERDNFVTWYIIRLFHCIKNGCSLEISMLLGIRKTETNLGQI
jgi:hypothetical protein